MIMCILRIPSNIAEALVQADKDFKELFYTNRNHGIYGGNTRNHLSRDRLQIGLRVI